MNRIILLALIMVCLSAFMNDESDISKSPNFIFSNIYCDSQLESQFFSINNLRDTSLTTKNGTIVKIYANSFIIKDSTKDAMNIEIELKEAFKPSDFVLGNLFTQSNLQNLQSDGMVFITARASKKELKLKNGSEIGFIIPTDSLDEKMLIYSGEKDSSGFINWDSPEPILNSKLRTLDRTYNKVMVYVEGNFKSNNSEYNKWVSSPNRKTGDEITINGARIEILSVNKNFDKLREVESGLFIPDMIINKAQDGFAEDFYTSYLFSVKKLGWASIDKLFDTQNSSQVEMIVNIDNESEFNYVFTSLILPNEKMYIGGYKKQDNSFSFSRNDKGILLLPIGSEATIIATAYKNHKPYFNLKKIVIKKDMKISFSLNETNAEDLRKIIKEKL